PTPGGARLMFELVHEPTGEAFPLVPHAGGAKFLLWPWPRVQTPTFRAGPRERVKWAFDLPRQLPSGAYGARLTLLDESGEPLTGTHARADVALGLNLLPPPLKSELPQALDLDDAVWLRRQAV